MWTQQEAAELWRTVRALRPPVLSLYVPADPELAGNDPHTVHLRARRALDELDVPAELVRRALAVVGEGMRQGILALFADREQTLSIDLPIELPVVDPRTGEAEASYGEPDLVPLHQALRRPRYGAVYFDGGRWRFFEIFLGGIEERSHLHRYPEPGGDLEVPRPKQVQPQRLAVRDDAEVDRAARHEHHRTRHFWREGAAATERAIQERGIDRLFLLGTEESRRELERELSAHLRGRMAASLPSLPDPEARASEVLARLEGPMREDQDKREEELLARLADRGLGGLESVLHDLQQGRLSLVTTGWGERREVFRDPETGFVAARPEQVAAHLPEGAEPEAVPLRRALLELAESYRSELVYLTGERERRLREELGGVAGLARW